MELFARYSLIGTICEDISFSLENVMVYYALSFLGDSGILANEMSKIVYPPDNSRNGSLAAETLEKTGVALFQRGSTDSTCGRINQKCSGCDASNARHKYLAWQV